MLSEDEADGNVPINRVKMSTSVRNPYKRLWEDRGVIWPSTSTNTRPSTLSSFEPMKKDAQECLEGKYSSMDAFYKQQDEYVLNMAIQESLKNCSMSTLPAKQAKWSDTDAMVPQNVSCGQEQEASVSSSSP